MRREIIFRGRDIETGKWMYSTPFLGMLDTMTPAIVAHPGLVDEKNIYYSIGRAVDLDTIGQFTGVTDKNGVYIFEGDVVNILCENEEVGVIKWEEDTARFIISAEGFFADFDNYYGHDLEVIDNIHDNPELLEEEI